MPRRSRRPALLGVIAMLGALAVAGCGTTEEKPTSNAAASSTARGGTLVAGGTFTDLPPLDTSLASYQGWEGLRAVSNALYDGLTRFDLRDPDVAPPIVPALATEWKPNADASSWTFKLRDGVTFHDGTPWDADAAIFNFDRFANPKSKYYSPDLAATQWTLLPKLEGYEKVDDTTIRIDTKGPSATLPNTLAGFYFASPAAVRKLGNKRFGEAPVGTGPFQFDSLSRGRELRLKANPNYWNGAPKLDEYVIKPLPDPTARVAALRSGEVNWIEYPPPDDHAALEAAGFQVITNDFDHVMPWFYDTTKAPFDDVRVRQALNYAIDRKAIAEDLLLGTADQIAQFAPKGNPAYRPENDVYSYDPEKAKRLLAEAGYADGVEIKVVYPTSGSGNMVPTPINERVQSDLAKVGVKVDLRPLEWATVRGSLATGFPDGANALNASQAFWSDDFWGGYFSSKGALSWMYKDPKVDTFLAKAETQVDDGERYDTYAELVAHLNEQAPWLLIVSDRNPRALAPNVKGYIPAQNWFVDWTTIYVED